MEEWNKLNFYPPKGFNSAEIAFLYNGKASITGVVSLLIYLANKGYIKFEEVEEEGKKVSKSFKIIKLKEYDGDKYNERIFLKEMFGEEINIDMEKAKEFREESRATGEKVGLFKTMEAAIDISERTTVTARNLRYSFYKTIDKIMRDLNREKDKIFEPSAIKIIRKRTSYGNEMLEEIRGFKNFLEIAEQPQLESLVKQNPKYFYDMLPYAYALGVLDKWIIKFEKIVIYYPDWYYGGGSFNINDFSNFITRTMESAMLAMTTTPYSENRG